jgi:DNA-binding beta-propeller fold protein YncE
LIDAVVDSVERSAEQQGERLVQVLKELGDGYYGRMSPWVKITTMFDHQQAGGGATLRMTLQCDHMALVEKVMYGFVEHSTCGILDDVKNKLAHVACGIPDAAWIEACAERRTGLRARIRRLEDAKTQILSVLGVESEAALLAHAQSSTRVPRIVRGDCGHVAHAHFSTDIRGVAVSREGYLYVADKNNKNIQVLSGEGPNGTHIKTLCSGQLLGPHAVALDDDGTMYVTDQLAKVVKVFDQDGKHVRDIGKGHLSNPHDGVSDAQGHVYVADFGSHVVSIFDKQGQFVRDIGVRGSGGKAPGQLCQPAGVALDGDNRVYISNFGSQTVSVFNKHGRFIRCIGRGLLKDPIGVAVCPSGRVHVASLGSNQVIVLDRKGTHVRSIPASRPIYVLVDDEGHVCVTEQKQQRVVVLRCDRERVFTPT